MRSKETCLDLMRNKWSQEETNEERRSTSDTKPSERQEVAVCKPRNHNEY